MSHQLNRIFKNLIEINPPEKLGAAILREIESERKRRLRIELFLSRVGSAGSLLVFFYTAYAFGQVIVDSEFWKIASLIRSDLSMVASNWQEFSYSLLETLPVSSLVAILLPIFTLTLFFNLYLSLRQNVKERHKYT